MVTANCDHIAVIIFNPNCRHLTTRALFTTTCTNVHRCHYILLKDTWTVEHTTSFYFYPCQSQFSFCRSASCKYYLKCRIEGLRHIVITTKWKPFHFSYFCCCYSVQEKPESGLKKNRKFLSIHWLLVTPKSPRKIIITFLKFDDVFDLIFIFLDLDASPFLAQKQRSIQIARLCNISSTTQSAEMQAKEWKILSKWVRHK